MRLTLLFTVVALAAASAATTESKPAFAKDVAPIVFNRCAECHRAGEAAPMSLTSYKEVRPCDLKEPLQLAKGDRIDRVAHCVNSPNNECNPDPTKEVKWGDQTWEEMMIGWFTYTAPGPSAAPANTSPAAGAEQ